jgi:hypothetical protein|tara:strand:- start:4809 stop:5099 length:291 start_codon:yes stop_codon:yes gene_type:complete
MDNIAALINDFGFPVVMAVGMGYFIFYVWNFVITQLNPKLGTMHMALIRVIDQTRMLDQDMIRLQQKVNVVLEYRAQQLIADDVKEKEDGKNEKKK